MFRRISAFVFILILLLSWGAYASPDSYDAAEPENLSVDMLYAESAILIDCDSGNVLFAKDEYTRRHPASTTKIMTLLLGIESGIPMDREIVIPQAAADVPADSSLIPVYPGDRMSFGDLLTAFTLSSGNDGANAIAVLVSGSVESFVALMNSRAQQIGCLDTHFANAHGYTEANHYTTAYDLALITREAMQNDTFREIVAKTSATVHVEERGDIYLVNKHYIMQPASEFYYEECIGVKTGSTENAGKCYVGAAKRNGATVISVVLRCPEENDRWTDTTKLFDYGWTCYDRYGLEEMYNAVRMQLVDCVVSNAAQDDEEGGVLGLKLAQVTDSNYVRMVEKGNDSALSAAEAEFIGNASVTLSRSLTAPITEGEIMGEFRYLDDDGKIITAKLLAERDVEKRTVVTTLRDVFPWLSVFDNTLFLALLIVLAIILLLIVIIAARNRRIKQRRRREILEQRRREEARRRRIAEARQADVRVYRSASTRSLEGANRPRHASSAYDTNRPRYDASSYNSARTDRPRHAASSGSPTRTGRSDPPSQVTRRPERRR